MKIIIIALIVFLNIPIYKKVFNTIFSSIDDFYESLRYIFTPDIFSLFRGEYMKDYFGEMKFQFFIIVCGGVVFVEYIILSNILESIEIYL